MKDAGAIENFIAHWRDTGGSELANTQSFINGLCDLLGVEKPHGSKSDDATNDYVFERRVFQDNGDGTQSFGRIDAYKRNCFILEAKQGSEADRAAASKGEDERIGHHEVEELLGGARRGEVELRVPSDEHVEPRSDLRVRLGRNRAERGEPVERPGFSEGYERCQGMAIVRRTAARRHAGVVGSVARMIAHDGIDLAPLESLVRAAAPGEEFSAIPMPGGASTRRYFRVKLPSRTLVGMFVPEGAKAEEIDKGHARHRWPFLEVRDLLSEHGVDVPVVYGEDCDRGWLLIEDLGDHTLANYLLEHPGEKRALYTRAVTDLARAQHGLAALPKDCIVTTRAFDEDLLRWEIDHFREWGLDARDKPLAAEDRPAFDAIADRLAKRIAGWTRGFTHRDYQSRNLMVRASGSLVWIDFQDALLGPRVYDLVALLNDSYQEFDRAFVEARLDEYAAEAKLGDADRDALGLEFDLVTVQRKLKDAGRFVFIDRVKKNPSFLRFVNPTLRKVQASIARLAETDDDMRMLGALIDRVWRDEA